MKIDLSTLTIDEKIALLVGRDTWNTESASGKVPSISMNDGPCGLRRPTSKDAKGVHPDSITRNSGTLSAVATPSPSSLSCTWNPELAKLDGEIIADDCIENGTELLLAPGVNIKRTPLCGRNFEYFSEDPYLAGEMAKSFITGVQDSGIGTSLKHFCFNNIERDRWSRTSEIDERTAREIYLTAFERALEAKPWTVMCSYNKINGIWASENRHYLKDILRDEFGFDGLIVSDWNATHDATRAAKATLDLTMPYNTNHIKNLREAYERGEITEQEIDERVAKVLELVSKCKSANKQIKRTKEERHLATVKIAEEAIVLLKNDNNTLPIADGKLFVAGELAKKPTLSGGGSACGFTDYIFEPLGDLIKKNAPEVELISPRGVTSTNLSVRSTVRLAELAHCSMQADNVILCVGNSNIIESEEYDRTDIRLPKHQEEAILALARANKNITVIVYAGSAIDMSPWIDSVSAVVLAGFGGEGISEALANVIAGKVSPSGKLSETYPLCLEDTPTFATKTDTVNKLYCALQNSSCDRYLEGVFVGYRYYDTANVDVLFPFGHGLSYADFRYTGLTIEHKGGTNYTVSLDVTNLSSIDAKETVQLYVSDLISSVDRPTKELRGFKKIEIPASTTRRVSFELDFRSFAFYNVSLGKWHVENGDFDISIGSSSRDIRLSERISVALPRDEQYSIF